MLIEIRPITAADTHALRQQILRPHQTLADMDYPGDSHTETMHLGAFDGHNLVGIASLYREEMPNNPSSGDWRLRGMAVDPGIQGSGVGRKLLEAAIAHVRARGGSRFWCNARTSAAGFYRRFGLLECGETFDLIAVGPHVVMARELIQKAPADASESASETTSPA